MGLSRALSCIYWLAFFVWQIRCGDRFILNYSFFFSYSFLLLSLSLAREEFFFISLLDASFGCSLFLSFAPFMFVLELCNEHLSCNTFFLSSAQYGA